MSFYSLTHHFTSVRDEDNRHLGLEGKIYVNFPEPDMLIYTSPTLWSREDDHGLRKEFAAHLRRKLVD